MFEIPQHNKPDGRFRVEDLTDIQLTEIAERARKLYENGEVSNPNTAITTVLKNEGVSENDMFKVHGLVYKILGRLVSVKHDPKKIGGENRKKHIHLVKIKPPFEPKRSTDFKMRQANDDSLEDN